METYIHIIGPALLFLGISIVVYEIFALCRDIKRHSVAPSDTGHPLLRVLTPVLSVLVPVNSMMRLPRYREEVETRFRRAGGVRGFTVDMFLASKELSAAAVSLMYVALFSWPSSGVGISMLIGAGLVGWFVPNIILRGHIEDRQKKIIRELPYILDLLTVSVEAGLDFMHAIERVVFVLKEGELTRELSIMHHGLQMGDSRATALRSLGHRTEVPEIKTVVSALIQADQLGTGIGSALRTVSLQARVQRSQRAEKMAGEATVKLLLPLVLVFVAVMLMVLGPVAMQILTGLRAQ